MSNLSSQNEEEEEDRSYRGPKLKLFSRKNDRARLAHPLLHLTPSRLSSQDEESSMTVKATIPPPPLQVYKCIYCDHDSNNNKGALTGHIWNKHKDQPTITTFRAAYDLVCSESYPLIGGRVENGDVGEGEDDAKEGVRLVTSIGDHLSSTHTQSLDEGSLSSSSSSSSSAIVSKNAHNETIEMGEEKVVNEDEDDKMEHTLSASLAVETREKTIDELSREANANREAILDALIAQAGMEDGMEDGGGGGEGLSRSRKASISKQKEKKERRVIPSRSVKRKRISRIRKPTDFFGRSSDMIDDEEEEEEEEEEDADDPYDSDATEPFCKIRKLTTTTSSSFSSSSAAGGGARRSRNSRIIHAPPPPPPLGSKSLPFSCQVPDCDQAGVTFPGVTESDRRSAGEVHIKSKHQEYVSDFEKDGGRVCDTCGKGYEGKNASVSLSKHKRLHDSLDWKVCDFCPYSSSQKLNVTRHILTCTMNPVRAPLDHAPPPPPPPLGSKSLPFSCQVPDCDQAGVTFPGVTESDRRSAGEAHMKSKHQEYVSDFEKDGGRVCDTCGKGYEGKYASVSLSTHKRLHDSLDWKVCDFCPYSSSKNGNVKDHIMNPDRAPPPTVKCKHCNEQVGVSSMSVHLTAHHGIGRFYKCLFCDYEMYNKQKLVSHIYSNHKDKPTITSMDAARAIVYADSFPFVTRNGSGST